MRVSSVAVAWLAGLLGGTAACSASAAEEVQLIAAINAYRSQVQLCTCRPWAAMPAAPG